MASLIEELIEVLEQECEIYESLIAVSEVKTQVIVRGDMEQLQEITRREQDVVDRILVLEKRRQGIVNNIAVVMSKDAKSMTIADIVRMMEGQPEFYKPLSVLHKRLRDAVLTLRDINQRDRELMESALEMTEYSINILQTAGQAPETANYSHGNYAGETLGVARNQFDSKS